MTYAGIKPKYFLHHYQQVKIQRIT